MTKIPPWIAACLLVLPWAGGCELMPDVSHEPVIRNPFPQLSRIAVAPFFNLSDEPTVDGRRFALAYFAELQAVPGFEVVPVSVVDAAMREHHIELSDPRQARRLAQLLDVDAVVVGAVTDFSPYYPPRCGLQTQWWAANPCYHPIPPGYGLPWCTPDEEYIPPSLVYEAEFALAKAQLTTQTPAGAGTGGKGAKGPAEELPGPVPRADDPPPLPDGANNVPGSSIQLAGAEDPSSAAPVGGGLAPPLIAAGFWPGPDSFSPSCPQPIRPPCLQSDAPVMSHTAIYNGHDDHVVQALETYYYFRNDARFGGWESYLQRSEDFIRFCCYMHISEMLSARGGAGQTRVVWGWSHDR